MPIIWLCMQVFLELVSTHPHWLRTYLVEYGNTGPNCPRRWAADMMAWTLHAASKRCGPQLQAYVSNCLRNLIRIAPDSLTSDAALQQSEQQQRGNWMPPLGQAMLAVVQQLVMQVMACRPAYNQISQMNMCLDIPSEPARVLLAYAESSPWAAAQLLMVSVVCQSSPKTVALHVQHLIVDAGCKCEACLWMPLAGYQPNPVDCVHADLVLQGLSTDSTCMCSADHMH